MTKLDESGCKSSGFVSNFNYQKRKKYGPVLPEKFRISGPTRRYPNAIRNISGKTGPYFFLFWQLKLETNPDLLQPDSSNLVISIKSYKDFKKKIVLCRSPERLSTDKQT